MAGHSKSFGRTLYAFQENVRELVEQRAPAIVLEAPVGSGKTLAALAAANACGGASILTYPTNALIEDQTRSVSSLMSNHFQVEVRDLDAENLDWKLIPDLKEGTGPRFCIARVNGDILDRAAKKSVAKGTKLRDLLEMLNGIYGSRWLLLTNIDLIANALTGRYRYSNSIVETLMGIRLVLLDEFHYYRGPSLIAATWSASFIARDEGTVLAMSGTAPKVSDAILPCAKLIREAGSEKEGWPLIRNLVNLKLVPDPTTGLWGHDIHGLLRDKVVNFVENFLKQPLPAVKSHGICPKVTVILNSPIDAMLVAKKLRESIQVKRNGLNILEAHGIVGAEQRHYNLWSGNIVVGTSAIEVGIDFDTPFLIAQGWDSYSFIQRLGRVGRKSLGEAVIFVPEHFVRVMKDRFGQSKEISYVDLVRMVYNYLETPMAYVDFSESKYAELVIATLLGEIARTSEPSGLTKTYLLDFLKLRGFDEQLLKRMQGYYYKRIGQALTKGGSSLVREAGINVPAIIETNGNRWFAEVDYIDAVRWGQLEILERGNVELQDFKVPPRFSEYPLLYIRIDPEHSHRTLPEIAISTHRLGEFLCVKEYAQNTHLRTPEDIARHLASGLLCFETSLIKIRAIGDWRLEGIRTREGKVLLLGANALLGAFLVKGK